MNHRQTQLAWLIKMYSNPAWRKQAEHRAMELNDDPSGLYAGIAVELKRYLKQSEAERLKNGG